jgi:hypothetical protein
MGVREGGRKEGREEGRKEGRCSRPGRWLMPVIREVKIRGSQFETSVGERVGSMTLSQKTRQM